MRSAPRPGRNRQGFTLVEMLVVGGVLGSLTLMLTMWMADTTSLWSAASAQNHVRTTVQMATNRMVEELRNATLAWAGSPPNLAVPAGNTSVTLYLPVDADGNGSIVNAAGVTEWDNANPVQYAFDTAQQRLTRTRGGVVQVLATNVTAARFDTSATDATLGVNELRVRLTIQLPASSGRILTAASNEIVRLRN